MYESLYRKLQTLLKECQDLNKYIAFIGILNIVKVSIFPQLMFRFNVLPAHFLEKLIDSKIYVEIQRTQVIMKNQVGGLTLPHFRTYH